MTAAFWTGRILFALLFVMAGFSHLFQLQEMADYAESKGVPAPKLSVVLSGLVILAGGLSVLLWKWVTWGAGLLFVFLLVAAVTMHDFWKAEDEAEQQNEMNQFMKNLALAGASLVFYALSQVTDVPGLFG